MFTVEEDGVTHINIYSHGKTELGVLLSNFSKIGFTHPSFGRFVSMEGYWYWIKTGKQHHELKTIHGYHAKKIGEVLPTVLIHNFEDLIKEGLQCKIEQNKNLFDLFKHSTLPFAHYYVYFDRVVIPKSGQFQIEFLEELRKKYKEP